MIDLDTIRAVLEIINNSVAIVTAVATLVVMVKSRHPKA